MKKLIICFLLTLTCHFGKAEIIGLNNINNISGTDIKRLSSWELTNSHPAIIRNETMSITNGAYLCGDIIIESSSIFVPQSTQSSGHRFLYYSHSYGEKILNDPNRDFIIKDGSIITIELNNNRRNIGISELSGKSSIIRRGDRNGDGLFVYTEENARITNCRLEGITTIEAIGQPAQFFNVDFVDTYVAMYNYEAGRIDRYGINVESTISGYDSMLGNGGSGSKKGHNNFWDWNPKKINVNKIIHQDNRNKYYRGFTASYRFKDKNSEEPVSGVYLAYYDDRDIEGNIEQRGVYYTNNDGIMEGRVNSKNLNTSSNIQLHPTLYILTDRTTTKNSYSNVRVGSRDRRNYFDKTIHINTKMVIKSYLHQDIDESFSIDHEYGKINEDLVVDEYYDYFLKPDVNITEKSISTVLAYTEINNLNQLYDRAKAEWWSHEDYPLFKSVGGKINIPSGYNLVIDSEATEAYSVSGNTITIKSSQLDKSDKFSWINSDDAHISFLNGGYIHCVYTDLNRREYVKLKFFQPTDSVIVEDHAHHILYSKKGNGGYAYQKNQGNHFVKLIAKNTEAMQYYNSNKTGIENEFYINFTTSNNTFTNSDRIELYESAHEGVEGIESDTNNLNKILNKLLILNKELQKIVE